MVNVVVAATSLSGHVIPVLSADGHLRSLGHDVEFVVEDRFAERVRQAGVTFIPLEGYGRVGVRSVLSDERYRRAARTISDEFARYRPLATIASYIVWDGEHPAGSRAYISAPKDNARACTRARHHPQAARVLWRSNEGWHGEGA
ncbi:glycosyltransferase [Actinoplanes sp. NPDC051470]|uniref:glycosyltransferase n=1 Tax=Actinoplanes sp. NPDC051470 TaxID=3157224 RepID=UPI00341B0659